jgi:glycogen debranching enzyme
MFAIEDLTFNCIFIRANQLLKDIAKTVGHKLPEDLKASMKRTEDALEELWDPDTGQYYSRNFVTHELIKEPSIATLMPLYSGVITHERAKKLVKLIENKHIFGPTYPIPSVPVNSPWFYHRNYWQGATWVNMNWLIIDGLARLDFNNYAEALKEATIELVTKSGIYEYYSPIDGSPAGSDKFSWTAALTIDLIENSKV